MSRRYTIADYITFHPEASEHVDRTLGLIWEQAAGPGSRSIRPRRSLTSAMCGSGSIWSSSCPSTPVGGQPFIETTYAKVEETRRLIEASGRDIRLQVDGGCVWTTSGASPRRGPTPS